MDSKLITLTTQDFYHLIKATLQNNQVVKLKVTGYSMWPLFKHQKTIVTLAPYHQESLRVGDVVLVYCKQRFIMHRIIKIQNDTFISQGDGLLHKDMAFKRSHVKGIVTAYQNKKTRLMKSGIQRSYWFFWGYVLKPFRRVFIKLFKNPRK